MANISAPIRAVINVAGSGDNTLVAAVTGRTIRVLSVVLVPAAAVTVRFESDADGSPLSGEMPLAANAVFVLPHNQLGWFETVVAELLNLELSGAVAVDGILVFQTVG